MSSILDKEGICLFDGLVLSTASIFLEGQVYLWDFPSLKTGEGDKREKDQWKGWMESHFKLFDVVVLKPGMHWFFGSAPPYQHDSHFRNPPIRNRQAGRPPPPFICTYLNNWCIQLDVMDTISPMQFNCTLYYMCSFILDMTDKCMHDVQPPHRRRPMCYYPTIHWKSGTRKPLLHSSLLMIVI